MARGRRRRRWRTRLWRSSTAWTVLIAGRCGPVNCCRSFSRILGGPQPGYSRFKRTIVASMGAGSRFACRADIVRQHGDRFLETHRTWMTGQHRRVLRAIAQCRTAALGGHRDRCDQCAQWALSYNSCRDRHCPKCLTAARNVWVAAREQELLPVGYVHLVFTVPEPLARLALANKRVVYDLLFRAATRRCNSRGLCHYCSIRASPRPERGRPMTINELLIVGLILLTVVCCLYVRSVALRRRSTRKQLPSVSEYIRAGDHWPYDLPALEKQKEYWAANPPDLKDPIDGRD